MLMKPWLLIQGHKNRSGENSYLGLFLKCYLFMTNITKEKQGFLIYRRTPGKEREAGVCLGVLTSWLRKNAKILGAYSLFTTALIAPFFLPL